ncbi:SIS domain-containing protein [Xylanimonas sp. McL0601]|uniref:SIS domain-containing protein n=1 Tax=Xylanimonas sp. McL0601 TaxID=3414739 RepID=UPI003CE8CB4C
MTAMNNPLLAALDVEGSSHTVHEIAQQPQVWRELGGILAAAQTRLAAEIAPLVHDPQTRIVLTGAGTSAFVGDTLAPALSRRLGRQIDSVPTTDLVADPRAAFAGDEPVLLVSFARSGNSPESLAATRLADQVASRVHHLVITCNPEGALARAHAGSLSATVLHMPAATNDRSFAMTSSFTSMLLAGWLVLGGDDAVRSTELAAAAADRFTAARLTEIADRAPAAAGRIVYLGSGPLAGAAREAALKMLELTAGRVAPYSDTPLGFRHGPKSFLDETTQAVVFVSGDDYARKYDADMVTELRAALGTERVLTVGAHPFGDTTSDWVIDGLDGASDVLTAAVAIGVAQYFALFASTAIGCTPDNPFPSGTVNRVVQGVTIYPLSD